MPERHGRMIWPGVQTLIDGTYTVSHGISPGKAILTIADQSASIAPKGDLIIGDGVGRVILRDCKLDKVRATRQGNGPTRLVLEILDRRWKWGVGVIAGSYNVPDQTGDVTRPDPDSGPVIRFPTQYIPWTIRTAKQLAALCLDAMGERGYVLNLPDVTVPLPQINWDVANPAQELQQLADRLGCRVIFRLDTNSVIVSPLGAGGTLPAGSIHTESPSIDTPETPDSILVFGAPARFQCRLQLEAVGLEWDKSLRPINELSYKPVVVNIRHSVRVTVSNITGGDNASVNIDNDTFTYTIQGGDAATDVYDGLVALINAGRPDLTASNETTYLQILGDAAGNAFQTFTFTDGDTVLEWVLIEAAQQLDNPWAFAGPPFFASAQQTAKLSRYQARQLASDSIFKYYRVVNVDPIDKNKAARIPGFGRLLRKEQLLLHQTLIEQVLPPKEDDVVLGRDGEPLIRNAFEGTFRELPAKCFGQYYQDGSGNTNKRTDYNGTVHDEVLVDFTIDPSRYLVQFSEYVYAGHYGRTFPAELLLETSMNVRDPINNQVVRYINTLALSGKTFSGGESLFPGGNELLFGKKGYGTAPATITREDIEFLSVAKYPKRDTEVEAGILAGILDRNDAGKVEKVLNNIGQCADRSHYYLLQEARKYEVTGALERTYNGIVPVVLDGAIQQVTWNVGPSGAQTRVGVNTEHSWYIPSYPERLRAEYQKAQISENVSFEALVQDLRPRKDFNKPKGGA